MTLNEHQTITVERYYTAQEYYQTRFDRFARQSGFRATTPEEYAEWKVQLRADLASLIGITTMLPSNASPEVLDIEVMDGYTREKLLLPTEPGIWMPCYFLVPDDLLPGERRPVVIAPHGHASAGKFTTAGRSDIPALRTSIASYHYDYGVSLVQQGFIVCCPDARGFGERRELREQGDDEFHFFGHSCHDLSHMALPLGQTVTGMWTWDLMRLIDYLAQRPECDNNRIGCAGLSGGGLQTLWLAAMDDRVRCAVVSGYFYGFKESLLDMAANCSCNYVPHLWEKVDMGDLGALVAPRPLFIETGSRDPLNGSSGLLNVTTQLAITREAYQLFGAEDLLVHEVFDGEHRWDGVRAIPWLKQQLNN